MVNDDKEIDFIPLHEISSVQEMFIDETRSDISSVKYARSEASDTAETNLFDNAFQIATILDGHNRCVLEVMNHDTIRQHLSFESSLFI